MATIKTPSTRLSTARAKRLRSHLDALANHVQPGQDPIDFACRYSDPNDQEVAALIASSLAFGRVSAFSQVLEQIFACADKAGGPAAWANRSQHQADPKLEPLFYRWIRGPDLQRWVGTIGRFRAEHGSVKNFVEGHYRCTKSNMDVLLTELVSELRKHSLHAEETDFTTLSRGFRYLLPLPGGSSASKRWCMFARWMTRSEPPDLGLWNIPPSTLVIPLDTHIHRISQFIGLTRRRDASWRTAIEITGNLKRIDANDPIRYDFVLAHLGISGRCEGRRVAAICDPCPLVTVCKTSQPG